MLKQSGNAIVWSYDGETLRAEPWGDASVRVLSLIHISEPTRP